MMRRFGRQLVALAGILAAAPVAQATINFGVGGLAGTGVTADVALTYVSTSATTGTLTFVIENTTAVGGRISAFAFNVPSLGGGTSIGSIGGNTDGSGIVAMGPLPSQVTPENQASSFNETGWFSLWQSNDIKTPNNAGDFDYGVLNDGANANKFITDGVGSGPRINNADNANDSTEFILNITGLGLNTGDSAMEQAIFGALSSNDSGTGYSFAVRFQGITDPLVQQDSDLATPTTTTVVPAPGAAALGALGLGLVGWINRRRA